MSKFRDYFNIKKMRDEKREYKKQMERVKTLPEDYVFVFEKIQNHMWMFCAGSGYDMLKIHYDLIDLFESGAKSGKHVLEITGEDVASFCEELLKNAQTYTGNWQKSLNDDIEKKFNK